MKRFILRITGCLKTYEEAIAKAQRLQDENDRIKEEYSTVCRALSILKKKEKAYYALKKTLKEQP